MKLQELRKIIKEEITEWWLKNPDPELQEVKDIVKSLGFKKYNAGVDKGWLKSGIYKLRILPNEREVEVVDDLVDNYSFQYFIKNYKIILEDIDIQPITLKKI